MPLHLSGCRALRCRPEGSGWLTPGRCGAERPGHGRYKLPTLKVAPRLPGTQQWKPSASWKASSYPKRGTMSKNCFFGTTEWKSDPYSLKADKEWEYHQMIESKVLFGNFKP